MDFMKIKQELIKTGVVLGVGVAVAGSCYYQGYQKANEVHDENIFKSNVAQDITESALQGTKVDAMIDFIQTKLQLVLVEQSGVYTHKMHIEDAKWNSWATSSDMEVSIESRASVGININDIAFVNTGDKLVVQYSQDHFKVLSLEVENENIITSRALFGKNFTDDEKIAVKEYINNTTKEQILQDSKVIKKADKALKDYIKQMADNFGVDVQIIDVK